MLIHFTIAFFVIYVIPYGLSRPCTVTKRWCNSKKEYAGTLCTQTQTWDSHLQAFKCKSIPVITSLQGGPKPAPFERSSNMLHIFHLYQNCQWCFPLKQIIVYCTMKMALKIYHDKNLMTTKAISIMLVLEQFKNYAIYWKKKKTCWFFSDL